MSGRISFYEIRDKTRFQTMRLTGNPKIQIWKSMSGRFSASGIRDKILFQIVCSIGNPNIEILRTKSGFTNRTHHYLRESQGSALLAAYILSSTFCSFSFYYFSDFGSYILLIQYVFILKITAS